MPEPQKLLSIEEVSELLQVPVKTLRVWRSRGEGPTAIKLGKHLRYSPEELKRWIDQQKETRQ